MVTRILETGAKQSADILEIKATGAKQADLNKVQLDIAEMKGRLSGIEGRIGSVEGRFNQVPTIWGMLGIVATLAHRHSRTHVHRGKALSPMTSFKTLDDVNVSGKRVLLRE